MRTIEDHKANPANEALSIQVLDEPGQGGACHRYDITGMDTSNNPATVIPGSGELAKHYNGSLSVIFQNGPIKEFGVNGLTQEALLAIVIDRLRSFQAGPFACQENANALGHCEAALGALKSRTRARVERGVEGTNKV